MRAEPQSYIGRGGVILLGGEKNRNVGAEREKVEESKKRES